MRLLPMFLTAAVALSACALGVVPQDASSPGPDTPIRGSASKKPSTPRPEPSVRPSIHPNGHPVVHGYWVVATPTDPYLIPFDDCYARHTAYVFATDGYGKVKLDVNTLQGPTEGLATTSVSYHLEGEWIESQLRLQGEKTTRSNTQENSEPVVEPVQWVFIYDQKAQHLVSRHDDGKTHLALSRWPDDCTSRNLPRYGAPSPSPASGAVGQPPSH